MSVLFRALELLVVVGISRFVAIMARALIFRWSISDYIAVRLLAVTATFTATIFVVSGVIGALVLRTWFDTVVAVSCFIVWQGATEGRTGGRTLRHASRQSALQ